MHKFYFPACPVSGPIEPPVPYSHMGSSGAVPKKCRTCECLFEGECVRFSSVVGHYMHLDHGPCGIDGPTDPVKFENKFISSKVEIPRKCSTCSFLRVDSIRGFHCTKDSNKWGDFHRGLDWGAWQPDSIYVQLPPPKNTTKAMIQLATQNNLIGFIAEYRRVNPGFTIAEAKDDFAHIRTASEQGMAE